MNLSWSPSSDDSEPIAVAREVANPSNYRVVYLNPAPEDGSAGAGGMDGVPGGPPISAKAYVGAGPSSASAHAGPPGGSVGSFGAAKLALPPGNKWQFEPLPPPPPPAEPGKPEPKLKREVLVVTGPSGSGKSHWIRTYVRNYLKLHPKNDVYLISSLGHDDTLDEVKAIKRIDCDKLVANPPKDVKTWANSLVIVDDVEGLDAAKGAAVQRVQDMIASEGRHSGTTLIRASHLSTDYKRTRLLLQEAHGLVLFPQAGAHSQYVYLLSKYAGLDKKLVASIMATQTRWLMVHHTAPRYILTTHSISLLS